jgi:hypothetical protein
MSIHQVTPIIRCVPDGTSQYKTKGEEVAALLEPAQLVADAEK